MKSGFITYQKFNEIEFAKQLIELLEENDIPFALDEEGTTFDPSFAFKEDITYYSVKLRSEDFERVNELLLQNEAATEVETESDYYLFDFTDEELKDVLEKADEWSAFDVSLAQKILADRGKTVSDAELSSLKNKRLEELKKPESSQQIWVTIGYISAFLGGVLGIFIGWHLFRHKKTLPNGEKVYGYTENDRKHGKIIFYVGLISTAIWVVSKAIYSYNYTY